MLLDVHLIVQRFSNSDPCCAGARYLGHPMRLASLSKCTVKEIPRVDYDFLNQISISGLCDCVWAQYRQQK